MEHYTIRIELHSNTCWLTYTQAGDRLVLEGLGLDGCRTDILSMLSQNVLDSAYQQAKVDHRTR